MHGFPMSPVRYTRNTKFQVFLLREEEGLSLSLYIYLSPYFSDAEN